LGSTKQPQTGDKRWSSSFRVGQGTSNSSPCKEQLVTKCYTGLLTWAYSLEQPKQWNMDMRFGTWDIRITIGQVQ